MLGLPSRLSRKESACSAGDWGQFLGWEDPLEKEMATHFKCSCLENPMDKGARQATVRGVAESDMTKGTKPPAPHSGSGCGEESRLNLVRKNAR